MKRLKTTLICLTLSLFMILFAACTKDDASDTAASDFIVTSGELQVTDKINDSVTPNRPTIFVHGYSGTIKSFGGMLQRFVEDGVVDKSITMNVSSVGEVSVTDEITLDGSPVMIQLLFEDNQNNEWNQAQWIKNSLQYLKSNYAIEEVNIVGHSMGGVSTMRYLTNLREDESTPHLVKFVALGAPFNDLDESDNSNSLADVINSGVDTESARFMEYREMMPVDLDGFSMLNIAGSVDDGYSDGIVPVVSVASIGILLADKSSGYEFQVVKDVNHSGLHESIEVDSLIKQFLWQK